MNTNAPGIRQRAERILDTIDGKYLLGSRPLLKLILTAWIAGGHVLIEGPPGTGKTLAAKLLAQTLARSFKRIQFTSDMLPTDILGAHLFVPDKHDFKFIPGPIFSDFVVADEINRTPPRTQSALLEAMEEKQITLEGKTHALSPSFFVVATQNPFEYEGTFPLPEAQLDRFLFRLQVTHADAATESALLELVLQGKLPPSFAAIEPVELDRAAAESEIRAVKVDPSILRYIAAILEETRKHPALTAGSSVRGGIALALCSRVLALLEGRDYVIPDDIKALAIPTLAHRVRLNPEARVSGRDETEIVRELVAKTAFPTK